MSEKLLQGNLKEACLLAQIQSLEHPRVVWVK